MLALRHQFGILQRSNRRRLGLRASDRALYVVLSRFWLEWRKSLVLVKPDTVVGWHRKGFRLYWKLKSRRGRIGRPDTAKEIRELIRDMSKTNDQ